MLAELDVRRRFFSLKKYHRTVLLSTGRWRRAACLTLSSNAGGQAGFQINCTPKKTRRVSGGETPAAVDRAKTKILRSCQSCDMLS